MLVIDVLISILVATLALLCSYKMLQIFQLSSYRVKSVMEWFKNTRYDYFVRYFSLCFLSFVGMFVFITCFSIYEWVVYFGMVFLVLFSGAFVAVTVKEQRKTPLKITPRIIRASSLFFVLSGLLAFGLIKLGEAFSVSYTLVSVVFLVIPFLVAVSFVILKPIERLISGKYLKRARQKLDKIDGLIKIGITGSFGKTTAKNILLSMLETKFKTVASPHSYNTPMGLCRYINYDMPLDAEVFIAEMGARYLGDIRELTEFIKPHYALITSVGNQHLDTFGSLDNVVKTKYELVEGLSDDGVAVFNGTSCEVESMFDRCTVKKYLTSDDANNSKANAYYSNLTISGEGTTFDLHLDGKVTSISTKLLGKHIAGLICACAQLAVVMGVSPKQIKLACESLKPVEHRLQLINSGDTIVLDDAYNSNLEGAKNALEVLGKLEGAKIIITPGFVELGEKESELNVALGNVIAEAMVDFAYLIGSRAKDIKSGILSSGDFNENNVLVFESLSLAVEKLASISGKKAVLFENDLPDNY